IRTQLGVEHVAGFKKIFAAYHAFLGSGVQIAQSTATAFNILAVHMRQRAIFRLFGVNLLRNNFANVAKSNASPTVRQLPFRFLCVFARDFRRRCHAANILPLVSRKMSEGLPRTLSASSPPALRTSGIWK